MGSGLWSIFSGASPAFNPSNDMTRYENAAKYAAKVMKHKLEVESTLTGGFNPANGFVGTTPTARRSSGARLSPQAPPRRSPSIRESRRKRHIAPSQDLVDAFPMKNGYPISDSRSGYDPKNPYKDRIPRFYSAVYYDGSQVIRDLNGEKMYTFETKDGGKDAPGGQPMCLRHHTT